MLTSVQMKFCISCAREFLKKVNIVHLYVYLSTKSVYVFRSKIFESVYFVSSHTPGFRINDKFIKRFDLLYAMYFGNISDIIRVIDYTVKMWK